MVSAPKYAHTEMLEEPRSAQPERIPWRSIEPLGNEDRFTNGTFGVLEALRTEWQRRLSLMPEQERSAARQRTLRKLAVETGIIERIYDVDWGLTQTLVAEGFTRDVVERAGGRVDDKTLFALRAHMDGIELVLHFIRAERKLSAGFVKELHQCLLQAQPYYVATDSLGRTFETELIRGDWKKHANHVQRGDGRILEYAPPEQVPSEMDRLVSLWEDLDRTSEHPLTKAAWLHHRLVQIHPFADGNGRVARALTLLVLEKHHYAPLVVDRWHRNEYLQALDDANDGNLASLTRLFVKLENAALTGELERPPMESQGLDGDIAHTLADQLARLKEQRTSAIQRKVEARTIAMSGRISSWFSAREQALSQLFSAKGVDVDVHARAELNESNFRHWYHHQIIDSARAVGHFANFGLHQSWWRLRILTEGLQMDFVASMHGVGREPGVVAVTTFAEMRDRGRSAADANPSAPEYVATAKDAFYFVHTEEISVIESRAAELDRVLEEGLAQALARLLKSI
jgi:fido (protein-threonine AMPylation protein)